MMVIYYRDSGLTWQQYLQANAFMEDITSSLEQNRQEIITTISEQTRRIIASNESLARNLEYGFERISSEIYELRASFDYNIGLALDQLKIQNYMLKNILKQLDTIHETLKHPLLTQARELSEIGMDRVSKGLLGEGLEALTASLEKNKTDFIVQLQIGKLYLYGKNIMDDVINLPLAKEHLLLAARYANSEIRSIPDATLFCAEAFLHAAISCYAQSNENWIEGHTDIVKVITEEAQELAQKATQVYPQMAEAFYNHSKFSALLGDSQNTINSLKTAILADRNYCLKADADKDFNSVREFVNDLFKSLHNQAKTEVEKNIKSVKSLLNDYVYQGMLAKNTETEAKSLIQQAQSLYDADKYFDFLDALSILRKIQETIDDLLPEALVATIGFVTDRINSLAFSPDGKYLVAGITDQGLHFGEAKIYQVGNFEEVTILSKGDLVVSVVFSNNGKYLAIRDYSGKIKIYRGDKLPEIEALETNFADVSYLAFSSNSEYLAIGSPMGVKVYQINVNVVDDFKEITAITLEGNFGSGCVFSFSPDEKYLAIGSYSGVKIYQTSDFKEAISLDGKPKQICGLSFSPDGKYLAFTNSYDKVYKTEIYSTDGFYQVATLDGICSILFSPDAKFLVSKAFVSEAGKIKIGIYYVGTFKKSAFLETPHTCYNTEIAFSPNGEYLAISGSSNAVHIRGKWVISIYRKGIISQQEIELRERKLEEQQRNEEQRQKKEQESRLKNNLCLECGAMLTFMERLRGKKYCKFHRL